MAENKDDAPRDSDPKHARSVSGAARSSYRFAADMRHSRACARVQALATMLGSAMAGVLARIPCHPIDTLKARIQVSVLPSASSSQAVGLRQLAIETAQREGWRGFYRGFGITFLGSAPGTLLYFTTYEAAKSAGMSVLGGNASALVHFSAGMVAEALSCVVWVPVDVIKERMQVQRRGASGSPFGWYSSTLSASRIILRTEGLAGLYRGYAATVASFGPFSALYFMFYEQFKSRTGAWLGAAPDATLPLPWQILTASSAGAIASVLTNPLDLVKLRLQVQRGAAAHDAQAALPFAYSGMGDALRSIISREGVSALWKGSSARVLFHAPTTAVTMALFERCADAAQAAMDGKWR